MKDEHEGRVRAARGRILHSILALAPAAPAAAQVESLGGVPATDVRATHVDRDGSVIAGTSVDANGVERAVAWVDGTPLSFVDPLLPFSHTITGMDADGTLLGGYRETVPQGHTWMACAWNRATGQRIDLGHLPGHDVSFVRAVSGDGSTVVGTSTSVSSTFDGFRWDPLGGMQPLGSLGGPQTHVAAVSHDGSVVVGGSSAPFGSAPGTRAFIWRAATGMVRVPGLADVFSYSDDVADGGRTVVGPTSDPSFASRAFYFREGSGTQEMHLGGGVYNSPDMILSPDGTTAAGSVWFASLGTRGFVWRTNGSFALIHPGLRATPTSISRNGDVVCGTFVTGPTSVVRAFRWTASGGFEPLAEPSNGTEWSRAADVSRDGSTIVGYAAVGGGDEHGALWRPAGTLGEVYCLASFPNSAGRLGEIRLRGNNWVASADLHLDATALPAGRLGVFLLGTAPGFVPTIPGSQGTLCIGGLLGRFVGPGQVQQTSGNGEMTLIVDSSALPGPNGSFGAAYGQELFFQAWYRDANPLPTSNFTSAVAVRLY